MGLSWNRTFSLSDGTQSDIRRPGLTLTENDDGSVTILLNYRRATKEFKITSIVSENGIVKAAILSDNTFLNKCDNKPFNFRG